MRVLLLKDVYKLGHAGDVKKVADGYGRNYLIPMGLATIATPGALKQAEDIRKKADILRAQLSTEMEALSKQIDGIAVAFATKAGETGKLYGSITPQMIVDSIKEKTGIEVDRRQLDIEPIRTLGEHLVSIRLTVDIVPNVRVIVHREGEKVSLDKVEAATEEVVEVAEEIVEVEKIEIVETTESEAAEEA